MQELFQCGDSGEELHSPSQLKPSEGALNVAHYVINIATDVYYQYLRLLWWHSPNAT